MMNMKKEKGESYMEGKKETAQTDIDAGSCTVDRTILYVRLPRELDHHNAEAVRRQADRMLERFMILRLVFDFQDTEFMDSSGIGVIMGRYKNIHFLGGTMAVEHVNPRMERMLRMAGVYRLMESREGE